MMITDKTWDEYVQYCKQRWFFVQGDRYSIQTFLEWQEERIKRIDRKWSFKHYETPNVSEKKVING